MIAVIHLSHPVRVGIDGIDCAGKTTLAAELIEPLKSRGRKVIRVSIDGFHNPQKIRYRQGRNSPRGYYEDSFAHDAIVACVLEPLGPNGSLEYTSACFNYRTDSELRSTPQKAAPDAILLFDGVFLHRPELREFWDFSIFVDVAFENVILRAEVRDLDVFEEDEDLAKMYNRRYIPGQKIYLKEVRPQLKATVVLDNNDIVSPTLTVNKPANR